MHAACTRLCSSHAHSTHPARAPLARRVHTACAGAKEVEIEQLLGEAGLPGTGKFTLIDGRTGTAFEQEVTDLTSVTSWSDYRAGYFIGAATAAFCPEYGDNVS